MTGEGPEGRTAETTYARVPRWRAGAAATLSLVTLGLLYASPLLLAATLVPLGYVVYGAVSAVPGDAAVAVERTIHDGAPPPGANVSVSVTVENVGEATLPDVRAVDGVPDELAVVEGSPRRSAALRPGESATVTYEVVARRGEHDFGPVHVRLRSLAGSAVRTETVDADGDGTLSSLHPLTDAPAGRETPLRAGVHPTDSGGPGTEFHSTRAYRPGDPQSRIHWRRYAKTGELTTVSFREERAVRTVLVVDARPAGRVSPRPGVPTGAELCSYAGERLYRTLAAAGVVTSVTALGADAGDAPVPVRPGGFPWADGDADGTTALARAVFEAVRAATDARYPGEPAGETEPGGVGGAGDGHGGTRPADDRSASGEASDPNGEAGDEAPGGPGDGTTDEAGGESAAEAVEQATPDGGAGRTELLLEALPPAADVVLLSPMLDDRPASLARTLRAQGYPVTVLSPDVTGTETVGGRLAGLERRRRLRDLDAAGVRTVGWAPGDSVEVALAESVTELVGGDA